MPDIFISYSRRDVEFGKKLHQMFVGQQKDVWMDWEDIPLTSDWWTEIRHGIETSDNFVLIMSPDSIGSPVCQLEIEYARQLHKRIVPLFHRDPLFDQATLSVVERSKSDDHLRRMMEGKDAAALMDENKKVLAALNWVFFKPEDDFDERFRQLSMIVDADLSHIRQHTRYQVKALEWVENGKNISFALGGDELTAAEAWLGVSTNKHPQPSDLHREFIATSRKHENATRRLLRGLQITAVVAGVLIILAIGMALLAVNQAGNANERAAAAATQVIMAETAQQASNERADYAVTQVAAASTSQSQAEAQATGAFQAQSTAVYEANVAETAQQASNERADYAVTQVAAASTSQSKAEAEAQDAFSAQASAIAQAFIAATAQQKAEVQVTAAFEAQASAIAQAFVAATAQNQADLNAAAARTEAANALQQQNILVTQAQVAQSNFNDAQTQVAVAATAQSASDKSAADSSTQVAVIGTTLTPIAPTLTAVADKIETGEHYAAAMRLSGEAIAGGQDIGADPRTAALLAIQSLRYQFTELADNTLLESLDKFFLVGTIGDNPQVTINASAFLPDGRLITAGDGIHIWDANSGTLLKTLVDTDQFFTTMALSPNGKTLVALNEGEDATENPVYVWDLSANSDLRALNVTMPPDPGTIFNIVFSSDNTPYLVLNNGDCRLWSPINGSKWLRYPISCYDAAFSRNGEWVAILSDDAVMIYPATGTGEAIDRIDRTRLPETFSPATFSPDSRILAIAVQNQVDLYDMRTSRLSLTLSGHSDDITQVNFTADSRSLVTSSKDGTIRVWNVSDGQARRTLPVGGQFTTIAVSPDGQWLVSAKPGTGQPAVLWTLAQGLERQFETGSAPVTGLTFSSDSRYLVGAGDDGFAVYDLSSGKVKFSQSLTAATSPENRPQTALQPGTNLLARMTPAALTLIDPLTGKEQPVTAYTSNDYGWLAFSSDGSRMVTVSGRPDGEIVVWDTSTWQPVSRWPKPADAHMDTREATITISPDGKTLLLSGADGILAVDLATGAARPALVTLTGAASPVYSPDGRLIAGLARATTGKLQILVLDAGSGTPKMAFNTQSAPDAMMFSPDGRLLAVTGADRIVQVLDVETGKTVRSINGGNDFTAVAFSPDRAWLAAGSKTGEIRLWNVGYEATLDYACGRLAGFDFTPEERQRYALDEAPTCP